MANERFTHEIHCPNPHKFPRFAEGFNGVRCKPLGMTSNQDFMRVHIDTGAEQGPIINIDPQWLRHAS